MIHISYKIKESQVHGIGIFADQDIKAGELIYTPSPLLDVNISEEQFDNLDSKEKKEIMYYGYFNKKTEKWHVAFDVIRFLNCGNRDESNVTQNDDMILKAKRDIVKDEELLQDYAEIYSQEGEHFVRIKK